MNRPDTLAEVARRAEAGRSFGSALSEFLDEFYRHPERRAAMMADEPPTLTDRAGTRHWVRSASTSPDDPSRFLHEPYFTTPIEDLKAMLLVQSPLAFRRRLIFTEADPLRRARMPLLPPPGDSPPAKMGEGDSPRS